MSASQQVAECPELMSLIFSFSTRLELLSFTRVQKSWVPEARRILFRKLVEPDPDSRQLYAICKGAPSLSNIMTMKTTLSVKNELAKYVRVLTYAPPLSEDLSGNGQVSCRLEDLDFNLVQTLIIQNPDLVPIPRLPQIPSTLLGPHLKEVHLDDLRTPGHFIQATLAAVVSLTTVKRLGLAFQGLHYDLVAETMRKMTWLEVLDCHTFILPEDRNHEPCGRLLFRSVADHPALKKFSGIPIIYNWVQEISEETDDRVYFAKIESAGFIYTREQWPIFEADYADALEACQPLMPNLNHLDIYLTEDEGTLRALETFQQINSVGVYRHFSNRNFSEAFNTLKRMKNLRSVFLEGFAKMDPDDPFRYQNLPIHWREEETIELVRHHGGLSRVVCDGYSNSHSWCIVEWIGATNEWTVLEPDAPPYKSPYCLDLHRYSHHVLRGSRYTHHYIDLFRRADGKL